MDAVTFDGPLDEKTIIAIIQYGIGQSVGFSESRLSKEREKVLRYYNGELPSALANGRSKYNSLDVFDSTEDLKAQLLDTFAANYRPVEFLPEAGEPDQAAKARTDVVTDVVFNQNDGFGLFQTVITDGLIGRAGVAKVFWEDRWETEEYELTDVAFEAAHSAIAPDNVTVKDYELHEDGQTVKRVKYEVKKNRSQVRLVPLPPEEFGISPMAKDIRTADLVFHRSLKTSSDLIKSGYDKKKISALQDNDRIWMQTEPELIARFEQTDDLIGTKVLDNGQEARRTVMVYECYLELDMDDTGVSDLWKIVMIGDTILEKERVIRKPFVAFVPLPRPHAFWGTNFGLQVIPIQRSRTYLLRSIEDHAQITTNPRYQVVKGGVANPRELMENRVGGIVNVLRPDSIAPLIQPPLNPFVFQTYGTLGEEKERITSISQLSQGLNKDAISKQNSQQMVQDLITVSQTRQKIIARQFAEGFLRDLYTMAYHLLIENEDPQQLRYISGAWTPVDFTQWPDTCRLSVSFTLGYGEREKAAERWMMIDKYVNSDPDLKRLYPLQKRLAGPITNALSNLGIRDISSIFIPPQQAPQPQPDPVMMAEVAAKQADARAKDAMGQAALMNAQTAAQQAQTKGQDALAKINLQTRKELHNEQMTHDEFAHKVAVDAIEIQLEHQAMENDKVTAVAEPT